MEKGSQNVNNNHNNDNHNTKGEEKKESSETAIVTFSPPAMERNNSFKRSPSRRQSSVMDVVYSDTESDEEEAEAEEEREKEKKATEYNRFKGYDMLEIYSAMFPSTSPCRGKKAPYSLTGEGWRSMWTSSLVILGGRNKYLVSNVHAKEKSRASSRSLDSGRTSLSSSEGKRRTGGDGVMLPDISKKGNDKRGNGNGYQWLGPPTSSPHHSNNNNRNDNYHSNDDQRKSTSSRKTNKSRCSTSSSTVLSQREEELMKTAQSEKEALVRKYKPLPQSSLDGVKRYGGLSHGTKEVSSTLRMIGEALENIPVRERKELVGRGVVELIERTALRTRLMLFLKVSVTPREINLLFKKFDPNHMGTVNLADIYGNAMSIRKRKKKDRLTLSQSSLNGMSSEDMHVYSSEGSCSSHQDVFPAPSRNIVVSNSLNQKVDPLGQLNGNMKCTVQLKKVDGEDRVTAEEVEEEEHLNNSFSKPDFNKTVHTDMSVQDYMDEFDRFEDPPTPDGGMSSTQNVKDFNTLEESDSVNEVFLCPIDEDLLEEEEDLTDNMEKAVRTDMVSSVQTDEGCEFNRNSYLEDSVVSISDDSSIVSRDSLPADECSMDFDGDNQIDENV